MRALAACLTVVLGLGAAATIAACSSTASDASAGGAGGATGGDSTGGSATAAAGKTSAGGTSSSGGKSSTGGTTAVGAAGTQDMGAAGAGACALRDGTCAACIPTNCATEEAACLGDNRCSAALQGSFPVCACGSTMTLTECTDTFGGTDAVAKAVADC